MEAQKSRKPTARAFCYFSFFFPLFWSLPLPWHWGQTGLLWRGCSLPGWHPPSQPAPAGLGVRVAPCSPAVFTCFVASASPTSEAGKGNPAHLPAGWLVLGGSRQRLFVGSLLLGAGARRPSPLFIQHPRAGYKRLPVKISFGTSILGRAFAKEKYCRQALGKQRYSSRGK